MANIYVFGAFCLCQSSRTLKYNDIDVSLGSRAFDLLAALVGANGQVLTIKELMAIAWPNSIVESSNVRVQVAHIRRALEACCADKRYIASVAGRGYCFVEPVDRFTRTTENILTADSAGKVLQASVVVEARAQAKLPAPLKVVVGRQSCIVELSELVRNKSLITLLGPAGVGKTTLAVLVAYEVQKDFDNNIFFVDLSTASCLETVIVALALAIGYKTSGGDLLPGLLDFLSTRKTLILFDNCEHVIAAVATLCMQITESISNATLLTTSREALRLSNEFVYMVNPLQCPPEAASVTAQQALLWPAIQLFMFKANEGGANSILADDDVACVAELCHRLDGNPHAIGLAASRVATFGIKGLANLVSKQFVLYWQGRRDLCPRQQTVEAMIGWSYHLLNGRDQQILCRLAVFHGEFPIEAAIAVASDDEFDAFEVSEAIANLADKSLIKLVFDYNQTQVRLFETTKAFAQVRLSRFQNKDQIAFRHALYYAEQLRLFVAQQEAIGQGLPDLMINLPKVGNVLAALEWVYSQRQDLMLATTISCMAAPLFLELSLLQESQRCCERALDLLPESLKSTGTELCLLTSLAITYYSSGNYDGNLIAVVEKGLKLSQDLQDTKSMFHLLAGFHLAMIANGRIHDSMSVMSQYAQEVKQGGERAEAIIAHWMDGSSRHFSGQQAVADESFSASSILLAHHPLRPLLYFEAKEKIMSDLAKARVNWILGRQDYAVQLALAAIEDSRCHQDSFYLCATLCFPVLLSGCLYELAEQLLVEMSSTNSDHKMVVRQAIIHFLNALLLLSRGNTRAAEFHSQQCVNMLTMPKISFIRVDALQVLAESQKENGNLAQAEIVIDEAIGLAEKTGCTYNIADLLRTKAEVLMCLPNAEFRQIESILQQALACAQSQAALCWERKIRFAMLRLNTQMKKSRPE